MEYMINRRHPVRGRVSSKLKLVASVHVTHMPIRIAPAKKNRTGTTTMPTMHFTSSHTVKWSV